MNLFQRIRERIAGVAAAVIGSILMCACGAFFTFYLAPRQAIQAGRISNLPQMDAAAVAAADPGDIILVTGTLIDNPAIGEGSELVAYKLETWDVTLPDPETEDQTPNGDWKDVEIRVPALNLEVGATSISLLSSSDARLAGQLHEEREIGSGELSADFENEPLPEGTLRFTGFYDGDLVTIYGAKATMGGVIPEDLFGGDRVAYEESEADAARGMLIGGFSLIACAPIILIGGGLAALFGRRSRRGFRMEKFWAR